MKPPKLLVMLIGIFTIAILTVACKQNSPSPTQTVSVVKTTPTLVSSPLPSATPIPPTATPIPLAAKVNGEGITLAEFQAEVARFQASSEITGTVLATDTSTTVLNELIDQTLLAQAAAENGYSVDSTVVQSRIEALENQLGGTQALEDWQSAHGYSDEEFFQALKRSIGAAWMRDQIVDKVPETGDEVHVLQILVPTKAEADQVYTSLESGKDFLDLASTYDPLTKGDLGWFPRGYLNDQVIEDAAFSLQVDQFSEVIQTQVGFHILYLLERDPAHKLLPDARRILQLKSLQDWIRQRRNQSEIQILVP